MGTLEIVTAIIVGLFVYVVMEALKASKINDMNWFKITKPFWPLVLGGVGAALASLGVTLSVNTATVVMAGCVVGGISSVIYYGVKKYIELKTGIDLGK